MRRILFTQEELERNVRIVTLIEDKNPLLNAYVKTTFDIALEQAKLADQKIASGNAKAEPKFTAGTKNERNFIIKYPSLCWQACPTSCAATPIAATESEL